jgi:PIN domain nuclease of toxin-antitoxin system
MFLLDICALLWLASDQSKLSDKAKEAIFAGAGKLFVSAISAFEIGVKHNKGALVLPASPVVWFPQALRLHGIRKLAVTPRIALRATVLPMLHRDPMDRMLIATAQIRRLVLLTPDDLIRQYPDVSCLW